MQLNTQTANIFKNNKKCLKKAQIMLRNDIDQILISLLEIPNITNINITVGKPFQVQDDEGLHPVTFQPPILQLTPYQTEMIALTLLQNNPIHIQELLVKGSCECSYPIGAKMRIRVNIFKQRGHFTIIIRKLSEQVPSFNNLILPAVFQKIAKETKGLLLFCGTIGSGKSTSLATILNAINQERPVHVITLEDPIEFEYPIHQATISQRELGSDFKKMSDGFQDALRQSPHVLMISEIKDKETLELALTAAENYLVLATFQASNISQAIYKIINYFPNQEEDIKARLIDTFRWILCQKLLPCRKEVINHPKIQNNKIPIFEILANHFKTRTIILQGETENKQFYDIMEKGTSGMQTYDQNILFLYKKLVITEETAKINSVRKTVVTFGIDHYKATQGVDSSDIVGLEMKDEYS
jgi:twitching motility protein PilT